jgi:apolipoprotein N-acyltransferase
LLGLGNVANDYEESYRLKRFILLAFSKSSRAFSGPIVSGLLLGATFRWDELSPMAWISLLPIASALLRRDHVFEVYAGAYFGGLVFNLIATDWIRTLDGGFGLAGPSAPNWILEALVLALVWPMTVLLGRTFVREVPFLPMSVVLPVVWVCHECLVRYASIAVDETGWPFCFLGYAGGAWSTLYQVVDISGVATLTVTIACANGGLWDMWVVARGWRSYQQPAFALIQAGLVPASILLTSYSYGTWQLAQSEGELGPSIMLMPHNSLNTNATRTACVESVLRQSQRPDLLVWPETAYLPLIFEPPQALDTSSLESDERVLVESAQSGDPAGQNKMALQSIATDVNAFLVVGCTRAVVRPSGLRKFNSAAFVDPQLGLCGYYDKVFLVPDREFTPATMFFPPGSNRFDRGTDFPIFNIRCPQVGKAYTLGLSVCYDIAFPQLYRRYMCSTPRAPDFFASCSSERADMTGLLARNLLTMAKFRAVECRRAIVRNVAGGYSGIITSMGDLRSRDPEWEITTPTLLGSIPVDSRRTLFVLLGDWLSIGCALLLGGVDLLRAARWLKGATKRSGRRLSVDC